MTSNGHFTLNSVFFSCQNLLIYLYVQRHDIYGEGIGNIFGEGHMYCIRAVSLYKTIRA